LIAVDCAEVELMAIFWQKVPGDILLGMFTFP
jgi:hypothetical protein